MIKKWFSGIVVGLTVAMVLTPTLFAAELILNRDFLSSNPSYIPQWVTGASPTSFNPTIHSGVVQPDANPGNVAVAPGNSLGGYTNSYLQQYLHIPRDAVGSTLTFYYQWKISYVFGTQLYMDAHFGGIEVAREQGNGELIQATPTPGWTQVQHYLNLPAYSDQNVTLRFRAFDDGVSDPNYIYVDDVSLDVITATKTITPTITLTATRTPTYTITPTFTYTPTITPTYTITPTITQTASVTPWPVPQGDVIVYPNPASGDQVTFMYSLSAPADISIDIYNLLGYKVAHLEDNNKIANINRKTTWNIKDIAPGVYLFQASVKSAQGTSKNKIRRLVITK
ncbi:T9SS type A sorting domain-containing protein [bacterium]|nr:T9SS type A sorting domain-containing protein [bacterium]